LLEDLAQHVDCGFLDDTVPALPRLRIEPTLPILRMLPVLPILRILPTLPILRKLPALNIPRKLKMLSILSVLPKLSRLLRLAILRDKMFVGKVAVPLPVALGIVFFIETSFCPDCILHIINARANKKDFCFSSLSKHQRLLACIHYLPGYPWLYGTTCTGI
jgi:hypothetical protein